MRLLTSNGWTIDTGFIITSPENTVCIAERVRITSPTTFVIEHPHTADLHVDTAMMYDLPELFRGEIKKLKDKCDRVNLTKFSIEDSIKIYHAPTRIPVE